LLGIDAQHPLGVRLDGVAIDRVTAKDSTLVTRALQLDQARQLGYKEMT